MSAAEFRDSPSPYPGGKSERTAPFLTKPSPRSMQHAADSNLECDVEILNLRLQEAAILVEQIQRHELAAGLAPNCGFKRCGEDELPPIRRRTTNVAGMVIVVVDGD